MYYKDNYMKAAVVILLFTTVRYSRITLAAGGEMNVTEQPGDKTDQLHGSTLRNGSAVICDTSPATNSSRIRQNITSDDPECLQNDFPTQPSPLEGRGPAWPLYFTVSLGLWSTVTNSLPLAAIIKKEQLHTPAYILMANLAASDVLTGTAFVFGGGSVLVFIYTKTITSDTLARLRFASILLSGLSSAYSLLALTAERYWFIIHGMTYVNNVTNNKCKVVIAIIWLWSMLLAMLPIFGWHCVWSVDEGCLSLGGGLPQGYVAVVLVFIFIPMVSIILLNTRVFWCLWMHMNAIAAQEAAVGSQSSINRKSAITVILITIVFLLGWLPFSVRMALLIKDDDELAKLLVFIVLNSSINPIIYGFRLAEVRRNVARLFVSN
ncbi:G-protein coupled receptor 6-like [Branchiostoma floridae x Branchiostoma japonicum]